MLTYAFRQARNRFALAASFVAGMQVHNTEHRYALQWFSDRRCRSKRISTIELLETRSLLAGSFELINAFQTWNAVPRVIPSTDPAGIGYYAPEKALLIADSEIDEIAEFNSQNVFQIDRLGQQLQAESWPGKNTEPTGITWNQSDGFFYVTNDDEKTITRIDESLNLSLGSIDSRRLGVNDPEDITSDQDGLLYLVSGHPPLVSVLDSHFNFIRTFSTAAQMSDAEGIAYNGQNNHLYLVSAVDQKIFEYTTTGVFLEEYPFVGLTPVPQTPQGMTFAPCTDDGRLQCLFIADGGRDNIPDGHVYEVRLGLTAVPYYTLAFGESRYAFGPTPENAMPGRTVGQVSAQAGSKVTGIKYSIVAGNVDGKFAVAESTGLISTIDWLDYESVSQYTLIVKGEMADELAASFVEVDILIANLETEINRPSRKSVSFQFGVLPSAGYQDSQDTKVRSDFPNNNYGTSTRLEFDGKPDMAAFLKWSVSQIPPESVVESATIKINVLNTSVDDFNLYQVFRPWTEIAATFSDYAAGLPWQVAGASGPLDRSVRVLGTVSAAALGTAAIELNRIGVAVVQSWVNDPSTNHGLAFQDFTDARTDDLEFSAKENPDGQLRPKLTVNYRPAIAGTTAWRNPVNQFDANGDTAVTPSDALLVINRLNQYGVVNLSKNSENRKGSGYYPDVSVDGMITPQDALIVINHLNPASEGEGDEVLSSVHTLGSEDISLRELVLSSNVFVASAVPNRDVLSMKMPSKRQFANARLTSDQIADDEVSTAHQVHKELTTRGIPAAKHANHDFWFDRLRLETECGGPRELPTIADELLNLILGQ